MPFSTKKKGRKIFGKSFKETTDNLTNRKNQESPRNRINIKKKAGSSFSIPSKLRRKALSTNNLSTLQSRQQEKITCNGDVSVTDSNNDDPEKDPDWHSSYSLEQLQSSEDVVEEDFEWETDDSVEQLRSSEFSDFVHHGASPISSTPFSPSKEKGFPFPDLAIPDVSYIKIHDYKNDTLTVVNFHSKSISSKKIIELPDISDDVLREYAEQDFDTNPEVPVSNGFAIPGTPNKTLEPNFGDEHVEIHFDDENEEKYSDDEYVEQNSDHVYSQQHFDREHSEQSFDEKDLTIIKNSSDVKHRKKKLNEKAKNFSKNIYSSSSEDSFGDNQNTKINMSKQKRTFYRDSISMSKRRWKIPLKKTIEKDSFDYMNNSYAKNNLENVQNIQNEEGHSDEIDNNSSDVKHRKKKLNEKAKNFSKNIYSSSSEDSFGDNQNTKINMSKQKRKFYRDSMSKRRWKIPLKKTIEKDSFEYMNNSYAKNSLENVQNIQNEEGHSDEIDNSRLKTVLHQPGRKNNKHLRVGNKTQEDPINIRDESQHSNLGMRNHKDIENLNHEYNDPNFSNEYGDQNFGKDSDEEDRATILKSSLSVKDQNIQQKNKIVNFSGNMNSYNHGNNFKDNRNIRTGTPRNKGKFYRGVGIKSNHRRVKPLRRTSEEENNFSMHINNRDEMDNSRLITILHQPGRKRNKHLRVGNKTQEDPITIRDESQHSDRIRKNHKDIENFNHEYNDPNFSNEWGEQNFENEHFERYSDEEDRATALKSSLGAKHQNRKQKNKVGNFSGNMDSYKNGSSFKDNRNTQTDTPKKNRNFYRGIGIKTNRRLFKILRSTSKEENFSTHINNSDTENNLVNVRNIQDEDPLEDKLDNNRSKTISYQTGRKRIRHLGVGNKSQQDVVSVLDYSQYSNQKTRMHKNLGKDDLNYDSVKNLEAQNIQIQRSVKKRKNYTNSRSEPYNPISRSKNSINSLSGIQQDVASIPNEPQNSKLEREKLINSLEKSGEDNFEYNSEDHLEDQNIQTDFKGKKGKSVRGVGNKRCNRGNRLKVATVQKNKNEARKHTWPICCLTAMVPKQINILKPVIREDVPIDCITLMYLEEYYKEKCQHS